MRKKFFYGALTNVPISNIPLAVFKNLLEADMFYIVALF